MAVNEAGVPSNPAMGTLACPDCGFVQLLPRVPKHAVAACCRCGDVLECAAACNFNFAFACLSTALLLLVPANLLPLMTITLNGAQRQNWLITGAVALWEQNFRALGAMVAMSSAVLPFLWLATLVPVLLLVWRGVCPAWTGRLLRWSEVVRGWAMPEVYLVGSLVAYSRLQAYAAVDIGPGGWAFLGAGLAVLLGNAALDRRALWQRIGAENQVPPDVPGLQCLGCGLQVPHAAAGTRCPRCAARLCLRKPNSARRTMALVLAAYLLYLPANLLPVMTVVRFGRVDSNTILGGVGELLSNQLWPLAAIVFLASIVVPGIKLLGLTWFLVAMQRGSDRQLVLRSRLYRLIEIIGSWSNIDVFMISILVALVQFGQITRVEVAPGAMAFAAVVALTMLASRSFDPRLMWDEAERAR
jgi:paraquat-inducible protein A